MPHAHSFRPTYHRYPDVDPKILNWAGLTYCAWRRPRLGIGGWREQVRDAPGTPAGLRGASTNMLQLCYTCGDVSR